MFLPSQCSHISDNVNNILNLLNASGIDRQNTGVVKTSLAKAIAPKFEIVFAGAFSAGSGATPRRRKTQGNAHQDNRC